MNSAEEQMLKHTSDLFDRVLGPAREGNMTQSFDAIHNAALEPPEPRPCEPGKHEANWQTQRLGGEYNDDDGQTVIVDCYYCHYVIEVYVDLNRGEWSEL